MKVRIEWSMKSNDKDIRNIEKEESITFTRGQFDKLLEKKMKMPVSILHL